MAKAKQLQQGNSAELFCDVWQVFPRFDDPADLRLSDKGMKYSLAVWEQLLTDPEYGDKFSAEVRKVEKICSNKIYARVVMAFLATQELQDPAYRKLLANRAADLSNITALLTEKSQLIEWQIARTYPELSRVREATKSFEAFKDVLLQIARSAESDLTKAPRPRVGPPSFPPGIQMALASLLQVWAIKKLRRTDLDRIVCNVLYLRSSNSLGNREAVRKRLDSISRLMRPAGNNSQ